MSSFFLDLPDHIKLCILDQWLDLLNLWRSTQHVWLGDMLSAVRVNKPCRTDLERLFVSPVGIFLRNVKCFPRVKLRWIVQNGLRARDVALHICTLKNEHIRQKALQYFSPSLTRLVLDIFGTICEESSDSDKEDARKLSERRRAALQPLVFADIAEYCPHLTHISISRTVSYPKTTETLDDRFDVILINCTILQSLDCERAAASVQHLHLEALL